MGQFRHSLAQKMIYPYNLESAFRNLLKVFTVKGRKVHKGYIAQFFEKFFVWHKWAILAEFGFEHDRCL